MVPYYKRICIENEYYRTVAMRISGNLNTNRLRFNETLVKEVHKFIYLGI
jgi:hypothetical protein